MSAINDAWAVLKNYRGPEDSPPMVSMTEKQRRKAEEKAHAAALAQQQQAEAEAAALESECETCRFTRQTGLTNPLWAQSCTCPPGVGMHT